MEKTIQDIVGAEIKSVEEVFDYWQIVTDKGTINMYNPYKFFIPEGNNSEMMEAKAANLKNAIVTKVIFEKDQHLKLELNHQKVLVISLAEQDYTGPEAISIHYSTGEIIIF